jgi:hypothetical protein
MTMTKAAISKYAATSTEGELKGELGATIENRRRRRWRRWRR